MSVCDASHPIRISPVAVFMVMHGKTSLIRHKGEGVFKGLNNPLRVTRYHSLVVREESCPDNLEITARTEEGEVMALRYKDRPWRSVRL